MSESGAWSLQFRRAFELAYFLHPDKGVALQIARDAFSRLEVAASAQAKRLYYHPRGGPFGSKEALFRTKVSLADMPLLQRLVYVESEPWEKRTESATQSAPSAEDLTIRYVKHLVQITMKRNSFYVTLGISRILHNYSTAEAMQIQDAILEDSSRVKDDDYFRSRKAILMKELKERFGDLLRSARAARGEERFEARQSPGRFGLLVTECLTLFSPWETLCLVPDRFQPGRKVIPGLSAPESQAHDGHRIEVNRMHATIHPDCYLRITGALGLDPPERRLEVPRFLFTADSNQDGSGGDRRRPPEVSDQEIAAVAAELAQDSARRKAFSTGLLRILVDGSERARLDPGRDGAVQIDIEPGANLVEVFGRDSQGDLLLAAHLLSDDDHPEIRTQSATITLERGQRISFRSEPVANSAGQVTALTVNVTYQRASTLRRALSATRRLLAPASPFANALRPAFVLVLALLAAGGILLYFRSGQDRSRSVSTPAQSLIPTPGEAKAAAGSSSAPKKEQAPDETLAQGRVRQPGRESRQDEEAIETRGLNTRFPNVPLQAVRAVFVECNDDQLRKRLTSELRASGRIAVVETPESADALVRISETKRTTSSESRVTIRLFGAGGKILWPRSRTGSAGRYSGTAEEIGTASARDLLNAIRGPIPKE